VTAQAPTGRKARIAANALARTVVDRLSGYATAKIDLLQQRIASDKKQIAALGRAGQSDVAASVLAAQVLQDQLTAQQQLVQAKQIELPSVLTHAAAVKTTARSRRNDVVVAAFLGFVLGLLAALAWEPLVTRRSS
jgi:hypothetical protein